MKNLYYLLKSEMNVPNAISLSRIPLAILYLILSIVGTNSYILLTIITTACISDILDGYIARNCGKITLLGGVLDPFTDKVMQGCIMLSFLFLNELAIVNVIIFFLIEYSLIYFGVFLLNSRFKFVKANRFGKIATVLFYFYTIVFLVLDYDVILITSIICLVSVTRLLSYVRNYLIEDNEFWKKSKEKIK